ncbi:MAG TPA: hypothetical protein VLA56_05350 [Pseudomonadales bacterium]|nr:hypothetical protein [Pseudomonadales bacterium]
MTGRLQALMIANAGMVLFVGMIMGLPFAFHLTGEISLWPLPFSIDFQIPGTERGWRAAHVGNILNGLMLLAVAAVFHRLVLTPGSRKAAAWALIITVWGNAVFYLMAAAFTTGRALTFGANRYGGGDWANSIGYLAAMLAVGAVLFALVLVIRGALAASRQATSD